MTVDLAVATPAFLDLTFVGLEGLPVLGEERFAGDLLRSPGGGAITAVGAARLGLAAALAAPLGDDPEGEFVRDALRRDGVALVERRCPRTPTTVVMPFGGDRAMLTVDSGARASAADIAALAPRAVATNLDLLHCVPSGTPAYVTCGDDEAQAAAGRPPAQLADARALFVNEREALALTRAGSVEAAAEKLAEETETVVVTLGADGVFAIAEGRRSRVPGMDAGVAVDTTGAGDLLVAAYIWAELRGLPAEERLRWSVIYAGLSVTTATAAGGAVSEARLLEEGARRGLPSPGVAGRSPAR
jgi:sugar/nucleoside kinase (ribokinase family)